MLEDHFPDKAIPIAVEPGGRHTNHHISGRDSLLAADEFTSV